MLKMNNYCMGCTSCKAVIKYRCIWATPSECLGSASADAHHVLGDIFQ